MGVGKTSKKNEATTFTPIIKNEKITVTENTKKTQGTALYGFQWINDAADKTWQELNNNERSLKSRACFYLGYRLVSSIIIPSNSISLIISLMAKAITSLFARNSSENSNPKKWHTYFQDCNTYSWKRIKEQIQIPFEVNKLM